MKSLNYSKHEFEQPDTVSFVTNYHISSLTPNYPRLEVQKYHKTSVLGCTNHTKSKLQTLEYTLWTSHFLIHFLLKLSSPDSHKNELAQDFHDESCFCSIRARLDHQIPNHLCPIQPNHNLNSTTTCASGKTRDSEKKVQN